MSLEPPKPHFPNPISSSEKQEPQPTDALLGFLGSMRSKHKSGYSNKLTLKSVLESKNRSFEEANFLYKVVKDMPFFSEFKRQQNFDESEEEMLINLCRDLKYEKYKLGDVIFKEGDPSEGKFYIVMKGVVYVVQSHAQAMNYYEDQNKKNPVELDDYNRILSLEASPKLQSPTSSKRRTNTNSDLKSVSPDQSPRRTYQRQASRKNTSGLASPRSPRSSSPRSTKKRPTLSQFSLEVTTHFNKIEDIFSGNSEIRLLKLESNEIGTVDGIDQQEKVLHINFGGNHEPAPIDKLRDTTGKLVKIMQVKELLKKSNTKSVSLQKLIDEYGVYRDKVERGGSFGHAALQADCQKRLATVIAATPVELLALEKSHLNLIRQHFYKIRVQMKEFLLKYFPAMTEVHSSVTIETYLYLLKEETYYHDCFICKEGTFQDKIFIIYDGKCQLMKNFAVSKFNLNSTHKDLSQCHRAGKFTQELLPLTLLEKGAFFGDESLFNGSSLYEYSVKVISPTATVYSIEKSAFFERFPRMTLEGMRANYQLREEIHMKTVESIVKNRYSSMELVKNKEEIVKDKEYKGERTFSNPIILNPVKNPIFTAKPQKRQKSFEFSTLEMETKKLKAKWLDFNETKYTSKNPGSTSPRTNLSPRVFFPKATMTARAKFQIPDLDEKKVGEYTSKIIELINGDDPKLVAEKEGPQISLTHEVMQKRKQRVSKNGSDSLTPIIYSDRAMGNIKRDISDVSTPKPSSPLSLEEQKFKFGNKLDVINKGPRKRVGVVQSPKPNKEEEFGVGLRQILTNFTESKEKSQRRNLIKEKMLMITSTGNSPTKNLKELTSFASTARKSHYRSISITTTAEKSLPSEVLDERRDSYGFLFVKSPRLSTEPGSLNSDVRIYGLDKNKNPTEEGRLATEGQQRKTGPENPIVENLIKKHKMLKALTKPSINFSTTVSKNPSLLSCFGGTSPTMSGSITSDLTRSKPVKNVLKKPKILMNGRSEN